MRGKPPNLEIIENKDQPISIINNQQQEDIIEQNTVSKKTTIVMGNKNF